MKLLPRFKRRNELLFATILAVSAMAFEFATAKDTVELLGSLLLAAVIGPMGIYAWVEYLGCKR